MVMKLSLTPFILEYPIVRIYTDMRAQRIYAGTNEIMREIVARSM